MTRESPEPGTDPAPKADAKPTVLRPRARLMTLLGDQLIRDAGVAVFELVKNAYDADASTCTVRLANVATGIDSHVEIMDNGHGMDLKTVKDVWLVPGTDHRKQQRQGGIKTPKFKRVPLGEKGLGRFAVHKLGNKIELVTRAFEEDEVVVTLEWQAFEDAEFLDEVPVAIATRVPKVFAGAKTGTRLLVTDLHDQAWTRRQVRTLQRAVTSICSPFDTPDEFAVTFILEPASDWLDGLLRADDIHDHAIFHFSGTISSDRLTYDYAFTPKAWLPKLKRRSVKAKELTLARERDRERSDDGRRAKEDEALDLAKHKIGDIELEFYIYDLDPATLKLNENAVGLRDYMNLNGGVRVYRDGVRVYDFGEPGNDWLDLGGRRINVPTRRIGNNQILGGIFLDAELSADLREKTNREGFIESSAYHDFRAAIRFALRQAETERNIDKAAIRRFTTQTRDVREPVLGDLEVLRQLARKQELSSEVLNLIDRIELQYREALDKLMVAAGAGLNLSAVLHEVEKGVTTLRGAVETKQPHVVVSGLAKHLADMVDGLTWLVRQTGKTRQAASGLIRQALFNWSFRFEAHDVEVANGLLTDDNEDFEVRCSRRLITTALANLIDNAIYWLVHDPEKRRKKSRKLYVGTTREIDNKRGIVVADSGPGFDDLPEYLVQPFFSRKADGMGLGLHITDEIMKQHGGRLVFPEKGDVTLPSGYGGAVLVLQFNTER